MPHLDLNDWGISPVLILGIDAGTTGAKLAFLKAYEVNNGDKLDCVVDSADKIHMLTGFPGYRQANVSTLPTCMIYKDTGSLFKWGHEAINLQGRGIVDPKYLITNWKLKLLEGSRQGLLETASQRLGKLCGGFATDFFGAVANYLFNEPKSCLLNHFGIDGDIITQFEFIDVMLALPPGWAHQQHSVFSDAVKKALAAIPNVRVITVSETECALRSWMTQEGRTLKMVDGEVVILLDLGGGTACLSAFSYAERSKTWVHLESYSLNAGSELVTAKFECDFLERFKETKLQGTTKALYKARQEFDLIKMGVGEADEPEFWDCPVQGLIRDDHKSFQDGHMRFSSQRLRSYFEPFQDDIFKKLDEMVTRIEQVRIKPKYCVLAGAYARNVLFLKRFHEANDRHMQMQVFQPQNLAELVATGACLTRIEGDCRLASGSRISVGIMTFMKWSDVRKKCPDAHRFRLEGDGWGFWCRVITWVIKKGDNADPDKAIIDHDGRHLRRRHIEIKDSIIFNETIFTSEAHPGKDQYTVLMYGTGDSGRRNKQDFREKHGNSLNIHEFTLDLTEKLVIQKSGSEVAMRNSLFKHDHAGEYFEYKYYMNLSQTDCRMSLEAFSATGKTRRMLLQYSISAFEVESAELQDEHWFVDQLSRVEGADEAQSQFLPSSPDTVRTRSMGVSTSGGRTLPLDMDGLRATENHYRSINDLAATAVAEGNGYHQSRQSDFANPTLLSNTRLMTESGKKGLHKDSLIPMNSVLDSELDPLNIAIATRAMKFALAMKNGIQEEFHERDKSNPAQHTPIRKRPKGRDSMRREVSSRVTPSCTLQNYKGTATDFGSAIAESDDSDYQPTKKPTKKLCTPSLKDPVSKNTRSSWRTRKSSHRLA